MSKKVNTTNARSTVGTSTEIYDWHETFICSRIEEIYSPISGKRGKKKYAGDRCYS
jgi:excinuclease ABC subunit A